MGHSHRLQVPTDAQRRWLVRQYPCCKKVQPTWLSVCFPVRFHATLQLSIPTWQSGLNQLRVADCSNATLQRRFSALSGTNFDCGESGTTSASVQADMAALGLAHRGKAGATRVACMRTHPQSHVHGARYGSITHVRPEPARHFLHVLAGMCYHCYTSPRIVTARARTLKPALAGPSIIRPAISTHVAHVQTCLCSHLAHSSRHHRGAMHACLCHALVPQVAHAPAI